MASPLPGPFDRAELSRASKPPFRTMTEPAALAAASVLAFA
ncbi:MAG: hypothetical protein AAEJ52_19155 [Myxococcota bacterium]